jgi:predicted transcriptional regulator
MGDDYLTLRVPRDLARALARWARERGLPKSHVVREAVARYLGTAPSDPALGRRLTAAELAERWADLARLTPEEARDLAGDLDTARRGLPPPPDPWA